MINDLKKEIDQLLKQALDALDNQSIDQVIAPVEAAYEKILIADYLSKRLKKQNELQKRFLQSLEDATSAVDTSIKQPEITEQKRDYSMMPEIKMVPHPEGPPAMRVEEEPMKSVQPTKAVVDEQPIATAEEPEPIEEVFVAPTAESEPIDEAVEVMPEPKILVHEIVETVTEHKIQTETTVVAKKTSIAEKAQSEPKKQSLHTRLASKSLSFGLNDRIAFVKHLFDGNAEDFNRVVNQLNTFESWNEIEEFLSNMVKPDYNNWAGKEEYEARFVSIVQSRFE
jgi:hypothetical protein